MNACWCSGSHMSTTVGIIVVCHTASVSELLYQVFLGVVMLAFSPWEFALILLPSKGQGFLVHPQLKTVSQRPSLCQIKNVATLYDWPENQKKMLIFLECTSF